MKITHLINNLANLEINEHVGQDNKFICSTKSFECENNYCLNKNISIAEFYNSVFERTVNNSDFYLFYNNGDIIEESIDLDISNYIFEETQGIYWDYKAGEDVVYEEPYSRQRLTEIYWFPKFFLISRESFQEFDKNVFPAEHYEFLLRYTDKFMIKHIPKVIGKASQINEDKKIENWKKVIQYRLNNGNYNSGR